MTQAPIISPADPDVIEAELTDGLLLRETNKGGNRIYTFDAHRSPVLMREVGRLREMTFRASGGGTGKDCDIDRFDTMTPPCRQLIVWDPQARLILGGYRYIMGRDVVIDTDGKPRIATSHMFDFSPEFVRDCLPYTIELGRSFVIPEYQSSKAGAKALYALDNLWDGLGALTVMNPDVRYLFGKMTMYPSYPAEGRNMIMYFLRKHFPDRQGLVKAHTPLDTTADDAWLDTVFTGGSFKEDYRILNARVRALGYNIPPLVNAYMSLSPTMRMFGTAVNDEFGNVEETGIMITVSEIRDEKKRRHIETFHP